MRFAVQTIQRAFWLALVAAFAFAAPLQSQTPPNWPLRSVKVIVPIGPGSATDLTARLFAERLSERWGQPLVVENRPGADGILAVSSFVAARDDHTLIFSFGGPVTINPVTHEKLPYDPERDLVPIAAASDSWLTISATQSLNVHNIADLVRLARANPGRLNWAGTPGLPQFVFAGFLKGLGLDVVEVKYRDFTPALQDLSEGRIEIMASSLQNTLPLARSGKVNLLAMTNRARSPLMPAVPTAREAGYPDLAAEGFQGFFGWRDMPNDLRDRIAADVRAVAADPAIAERLAPLGQGVRASTPAEFAAMVTEQRAKMVGIAKSIGLTPVQ